MMKKNNLQPDKVAGKLAKSLWSLQIKWSNAMSKIESKIPFRKQRWMVVLFVFICSTYFSLVAIRSITGEKEQGITVQSIQRPAYIIRSEDKNEALRLPEPEVNKIKLFQRYMDSLRTTTSGQRIYDSIIKIRPGLIDSIKVITELIKR